MNINESASFVGQTVTVQGWLYNSRSSGSLAFLEVRDGTGFMQCVASKDNVGESMWQTITALTQEASVRVTGMVSAHPKKQGVFELQVSSVELVSVGSNDYPISLKEHGPDFLMDNRHLWIRTPSQWAILRIRDVIYMAMEEYLHINGFIRTDSPIFTPNACEGTTTLFPVEYFDEGTAYLSQSGQLYLEALIASVGKCYDFGPVFRAEKSKTKRHLNEFWMMDAEAAYANHEDNLKTQEELVKFIISKCLEKCVKEFEILNRNTDGLKVVVSTPFTRYDYDDAIVKLNELGSDIKHGEDLGNDDEVLLTKDSPVPVFIEKWPKSIKPFYMKIDPTNSNRVLNDDLIAIEGAGEIIGGSQREDDYDLLLSRILADGLSQKDYQWYLDIRKYGSVPHSGFGIGLERMVLWMSGAEHVRECIPFPRTINRLSP